MLLGYLVKFNIVQAPGEERFKITENSDYTGWDFRASFYAYTSEQSGTQKYWLQNINGASAQEKWRLKNENSAVDGWVNREWFWAYPDDGGAQPQSDVYKYYSLTKDDNSKVHSADGNGWTTQLSFWAYHDDKNERCDQCPEGR